MAAGIIVLPPYFPARNRNDNLVSGALLYVYENRTTTKISVYSDEALTVPVSNPIVANSSGRFPNTWAESGTESVPVLYTLAITGPEGESLGNNSVFHDYRPSVDFDIATVALADAAVAEAEGAAEDAEAAAAQAAADLAEIQDIAANAPDAPSILNKANIPLDNTSFRPFTGGIFRDAPSKMRDIVDIRDFDVDPTGNNSSAAGISAALLEGRYRRLNFGNGIFVWDNPEPMLINQPIQIYGAGRRSLSTIGTTLKFVGTGTKAVRTFEKAPADGSDDPISCQIIVSSSFVHMEDLNILTNFDPATSTIDNPGDDWDVSLMVTGQSPNFTTTRIRNNGYPRMAGLLFDVTQPSGGMDQHLSESCWWKGGLYGMWIRGPIPPTPNVDPVPGDTRGQGGMSSSLWLNPVFQGFEHFSKIRYNDTEGGGFKISGRIPTIYKRLNDNTMIGARCTGFEPEAYNIDWASGFCMIKQHPERGAGFLRDGVTGVSALNTFARVTDNARNVSMINGDIGNMTIDWAEDEGVVFHQGIRQVTNSGLQPFLAPTIANLQKYGAPTLLPRIRGSTGQLSAGSPYTTQSCRYNKTTGFVTVNIQINMSDITGLSGDITIDQLPFVRRADIGAPQAFFDVTVANVNTGLDAAPIKARLNQGQSTLSLFRQLDAANIVALNATDLAANSGFYLTITYPVDPNAISI